MSARILEDAAAGAPAYLAMVRGDPPRPIAPRAAPTPPTVANSVSSRACRHVGARVRRRGRGRAVLILRGVDFVRDVERYADEPVTTLHNVSARTPFRVRQRAHAAIARTFPAFRRGAPRRTRIRCRSPRRRRRAFAWMNTLAAFFLLLPFFTSRRRTPVRGEGTRDARDAATTRQRVRRDDVAGSAPPSPSSPITPSCASRRGFFFRVGHVEPRRDRDNAAASIVLLWRSAPRPRRCRSYRRVPRPRVHDRRALPRQFRHRVRPRQPRFRHAIVRGGATRLAGERCRARTAASPFLSERDWLPSPRANTIDNGKKDETESWLDTFKEWTNRPRRSNGRSRDDRYRFPRGIRRVLRASSPRGARRGEPRRKSSTPPPPLAFGRRSPSGRPLSRGHERRKDAAEDRRGRGCRGGARRRASRRLRKRNVRRRPRRTRQGDQDAERRRVLSSARGSVAVDRLTLAFVPASGSVFGVNGAGKSTTLKTLCGEHAPTAGAVAEAARPTGGSAVEEGYARSSIRCSI